MPAHLGTAEYRRPALMLGPRWRPHGVTGRMSFERHWRTFLVASEDQPTFRLGAAPLLVRLLVGIGEVERAATFVTEDLDEVASNERLTLSLMTSRAVVREAEERWDERADPVRGGRAAMGPVRVPRGDRALRVGRRPVRTRHWDTRWRPRGGSGDARTTFEALGARPWLDEVDRADRDAGA